jgi:hypothetical protein
VDRREKLHVFVAIAKIWSLQTTPGAIQPVKPSTLRRHSGNSFQLGSLKGNLQRNPSPPKSKNQ